MADEAADATRGTATVIQHEGKHASILVQYGDDVLHTEQVIIGEELTTIAIVQDAAPVVRQVSIPLPDPAAALRYQRSVLGTDTGRYVLKTNSCVTHCGDVLRAGGVEAVPKTTLGLMKWLMGQ